MTLVLKIRRKHVEAKNGIFTKNGIFLWNYPPKKGPKFHMVFDVGQSRGLFSEQPSLRRNTRKIPTRMGSRITRHLQSRINRNSSTQPHDVLRRRTVASNRVTYT